jgi:hypothetical protein
MASTACARRDFRSTATQTKAADHCSQQKISPAEMQDAVRELRDLAEWHRQLAKVGRESHRRVRLKMAEDLERRAAELEARNKRE